MASDERRMCYVCGTIHRPGENTLCPVTQVAGKREPRSLDEICRIARESQLESLQKQATPLGLHIVTTAQMAVLEAAEKWWDACEADQNLESTERALASAVSRVRREHKR